MRRRTPGLALSWQASAACMVLACAVSPAGATSFAEAYAAARSHDALFRAAGYDNEAAQHAVPVARAALLPQIGLNFSRSEVSGSRQFFNQLDQEVKVQVDYASPQSALSMRLALFNKEARARLDQAQAQALGADAVLRVRSLDLIDRLGASYLQVLLTEQNLELSRQQEVALQGQQTRAEARFKRGEGTRTDQAQTQAALDLAKVRVLEANDLFASARRGFKRIAGLEPVRLNQISPDFRPDGMVPDRLAEWLELAVRNNANVQARQQAVVAARHGVERQKAGHYPRVDLVANIGRSENDSLQNLGQTSVLKSIGVQVNVPLYSGGAVSSSVRQASAELARAEEELRSERENVEVEVQRYFQYVTNGAEKVDAYRRAVESTEVAYRGATRAQEAGLATTADVLDAQANLYVAQRDLAQARYDYLLARLRLMAFAGMPLEEVVADVDRLLTVRRTP